MKQVKYQVIKVNFEKYIWINIYSIIITIFKLDLLIFIKIKFY